MRSSFARADDVVESTEAALDRPVRGAVEAAVCYCGDEAAAPIDLPLVRAAAATLHASEEGSAAFALDVAVVCPPEGGEARTVLVECNDGFALGLYPGCSAELYARMMVARWDELVCRAEDPVPHVRH